MSLDKLVDSSQLDADLTSVANAIRTKGGTSASLAFPSEFVSAIGAISGGGGGLSVDEFSATMASTDATIVFNCGDYTIPDQFILFLKSDVSEGDGTNIIIRSGYYTNETRVAMMSQPGNSSQSRYFVWKASGTSDYYSPSGPNKLTKSGSTLSLIFSTSHKFLSGKTYSIQIYELDSTFFA